MHIESHKVSRFKGLLLSILETKHFAAVCFVYSMYYVPQNRREIIYCKRAILSLSSSKIFTPHPPLRPASVYPPPLLGGGGDRLAGRRGDGGSIFWKTREIGLPSYSKWSLYAQNRPILFPEVISCTGTKSKTSRNTQSDELEPLCHK